MSNHKLPQGWPEEGHFTKTYRPYGIRVTRAQLDRIDSIENCTVVRERGKDPYVYVNTTEGKLEMTIGGWILKDSDGNPYPVSHEEMINMYKPI